MSRKELTKTFMMISNGKKSLWSPWFMHKFSALLGLAVLNEMSRIIDPPYKLVETYSMVDWDLFFRQT